jgi:hypothetical protein
LASNRKQFGRGFAAAFAFIAVLIVLAALTHSAIARQLNDWKLLPQPERFTELSFTHPTSLPKTYTPNQTQTIAFTVHNVEYRTTDYAYTIAASAAGQTHILMRGTFMLKQNGTQNVAVLVTIPVLASREEISVNLANVSTSIDFWLNETEAKT